MSAHNQHSAAVVIMIELDHLPESSPGLTTDWLCVPEQVTEPLCASVVPSVNWESNNTCFLGGNKMKLVNIYKALRKFSGM